VSLYSQLNDTAHLFRLIQKRLLARFKDKNPVSLSGADVLMRETYARLLQISDTAELKQRQLARRSQELACQSRLLIQMTALRLHMHPVARSLLESYLCVEYLESTGGNDDTSATGWEETVDAAMKHLLKTALAKQPKDVGQLSAPLDMPLDIESLKKHIAVVFDRLDKGAVIPSFPGNFVSPSSSTET
jgi:Bardet-Biedl syndrome 9 protein